MVSCFMIFVVLLLGEVYCRYFTRINFLDNSRELFIPNMYGRSWGNKPNFEGVSFDHKFHIDSEGFRADPQSNLAVPENAPAILIMGDSVAFGAGVEDNETITEYLRRDIPDRRFYNATAIGYNTFDYKNVIESLLKQKPGIKTVALFFCLNDIHDASAMQIKLASNSDEIPDPEPDKKSTAHRINQFLRTRSKLYLWIKNALQDTRLIYFRTDTVFYNDDNNVKFALQPLVEVKKTLDAAGVRLKVFLVPYEAQVRPESPEDFLNPQKLVGAFLRANSIEYYDMAADFKKVGSSDPLYLFGDPMHFSPEGNKIAADAACRNLGETCLAKQ